MYTPSVVKHNKDYTKYVSLNSSHKNGDRNHTNVTFSRKTYTNSFPFNG